ncbi:MAG: exodeoxyribonuclease VII large subunit [Kiritimatiellia bacterium]
MNSGERKVYSVGELTRFIRTVLESGIGSVWVEGEVSNVRRPSSGHCYFTIKDESAQLSAVLFRNSRGRVKFELADGLQVRAFGDITVYERNGRHQIIIREMEESGKGALHARFEALKKKLAAEGLFAASRKKPVPLLPRHVGIVTSPTGAAVRDILQVIGRRFPDIHVILAPVRVQGEGAAGEIAGAIDTLNKMGGLDVLIVGRGGGSLEDLWCFNEEIAARAVANSSIPVISAVGHEIDFTITDFAADLRVPTPSAAAELVVEKKDALSELLAEKRRRMREAAVQRAAVLKGRLGTVAGSYVFREPSNAVRRCVQKLNELKLRMRSECGVEVRENRQRLDDAGLRVLHEIRIKRQSCRQDLERLATQMRALNPLAVLDRGYSITRDSEGRVIRNAGNLRKGQQLRTRLAKGSVVSEVADLNKECGVGGQTQRRHSYGKEKDSGKN